MTHHFKAVKGNDINNVTANVNIWIKGVTTKI